MNDVTVTNTVALASLIAVALIAAAMLSGWRGWLALKRAELDRSIGAVAPTATAGARIEIADLKERIKKLEAIAAGVDL